MKTEANTIHVNTVYKETGETFILRIRETGITVRCRAVV